MRPAPRRSLLTPAVTLLASVGLHAGGALAQAAQPAAPPAPAPTAQANAGAPAEGQAPTPAAPSAESAQAHLRAALEHFRASRYEQAVQEFELAYRAAPSADLLFNIGRAYEQMSRYSEAASYYERYLRDRIDAPDRSELEGRIRTLRDLAERRRQQSLRQAGPAQVHLEVPQRGAALFLNDRPFGVGPLDRVVELEENTYAVRATMPGMQEWRANLRVRSGDRLLLAPRLLPAASYRTVRGATHIASIIVGSLGIAGIGVGAGFGIRAVTQDRTASPCGAMGNNSCGRLDSAAIADVSFGLGAGLLLTGAILWFVENAAARTERIEGSGQSTPGQ